MKNAPTCTLIEAVAMCQDFVADPAYADADYSTIVRAVSELTGFTFIQIDDAWSTHCDAR